MEFKRKDRPKEKQQHLQVNYDTNYWEKQAKCIQRAREVYFVYSYNIWEGSQDKVGWSMSLNSTQVFNIIDKKPAFW